jgi:hypothetical protein
MTAPSLLQQDHRDVGQPSAHTLINQALAPLGVICTGQAHGILYFGRLPGATNDNVLLIERVRDVLYGTPEIHQALQGITAISLELTEPKQLRGWSSFWKSFQRFWQM